MKKLPALNEITDKLSPMFDDEGLQLVIVFGSVVSGKVHQKSDIDLAFLFDKPVDIIGLTNRVISLLRSDNIDVVDLMRASPLLSFSIVRNGELLYEKMEGNFNTFCSLAFRRYADTKKLRDAQAQMIKQFVSTRRSP
jgi:predicted nucleotidyltransferase